MALFSTILGGSVPYDVLGPGSERKYPRSEELQMQTTNFSLCISGFKKAKKKQEKIKIKYMLKMLC